MNCDPLARWYRTLEYLGMGRTLERRRSEFLPELSTGNLPPAPGRCIPFVADQPGSQGGSGRWTAASGHRWFVLPRGGLFPRPTKSDGCAAGQTNGARRPPSTFHGANPRRALLLGDGDGRFLAALLTVNPTVRVDYVDSSAKMLALARQRSLGGLGKERTAGRVHFIHADARQWSPPAGTVYDLVVTHFFLDCLTDAELALLLAQLEPHLARNAVWLLSEFHQPRRGLPAWRARLWIGGLYRAFGWLTGLRVRRLPDHHHALANHQFILEQAVQAEWGLLVSEWWQRSA